MTVRYHTRQDRLVPEYVCQRDGVEHAISICQRVVGDQIDNAVGQLLVESVAPLALEVTLSVQEELQARIEEVDKLRKKQVERARYEADLAQRRYLHVDPANRLVADSLRRSGEVDQVCSREVGHRGGCAMKKHVTNPEAPLPDLPTVVLSGSASGRPPASL